MNAPIDVLGLGAVAWDELLTIGAFPPADAKVRLRRRVFQCGGLTGGALIAAARFGARCAYAGRLGVDPASEAVEEAFAREGIDTSEAVCAPESRVVQSTIIVAEETGTRNVFSLSPGNTGAHETLPAPDVIGAAGVLLVDHHGIAGSIRAARIARAAGRPVVADFERADGAGFGELLALAGHLIVGESFAAALTGAASPAEAARRLWVPEREVVIVTCGAAGGWLFAAGHDEAVHWPALPAATVDSTGCGDVFHGLYAATLAAGVPLERRVRIAAAGAAIKAGRRSGPDAIPRREEILALAG